MSDSKLRIKFTIIFSVITILAFSQKQESITHDYFKTETGSTLRINLQHTALTIVPSNNDSIAIHTHIRVYPTNPEAPFAGISVENTQQDSLHVSSSIIIGEEIQPNNALESRCEIHLPKGANLKIESHYGIIDINAVVNDMESTIAYTTLKIGTQSSFNTLAVTANYSTLSIDELDNTLEVDGKNIHINADRIKNIESKTEFSVFNINSAKRIKSESYTDKIVLGQVDSMFIESKKTLCHIGNLNLFFQGEMEDGTLFFNEVSPSFEAINIANSHVKSTLNFNKDAHFLVNADMRYCLLKQEQLNLQKVVSPNSTLYRGSYGSAQSKTSNLSIISAFEDVTIHIK